MSADVDLVSEIIKHERKSPEPVNCAGLYEYIWNANPSAMTGQVILPLLADVGAARAKAQTAYTKWMEYMTAVVWKSISLSFLAYDSQRLTSGYQVSGTAPESRSP